MCTGLNLSETMNEVAKSSTVNDGDVTGSVDGVLASDCSTLEELENFIDRSFKNMGKLPPKAIDGSTPSRKLYDSESDTLAERFETLKMEIESGVLLLKAELSIPTQNTNIKSPFFYHRTRHRQSPNLVEWQNHLQLVYSGTRSSAPMNHQLIPKLYPRLLMDIQCYPVKPLPIKPRRKDQLNWFHFYY